MRNISSYQYSEISSTHNDAQVQGDPEDSAEHLFNDARQRPAPSSSSAYSHFYPHNAWATVRGGRNDFSGTASSFRSNHSSGYIERGRRNPYMVGSVVVVFLILFVSYHRGADHRTQSMHIGVTPDTSKTVKGITGDRGPTASKYNGQSSTPVTKTEEKEGSSSVHLAYLLSYPVSGTYLLLELIQSISNIRIATNIGTYTVENPLGKITSNNTKTVSSSSSSPTSIQEAYVPPISIFGTDNSAVSLNQTSKSIGPYWIAPPTYSNPSSYILTETHCAGACDFPCLPDEYLQTLSTFEQACRTVYLKSPPALIPNGSIRSSNTSLPTNVGRDSDTIRVQGTYDQSLVTRAIHLIRDPFSNIVSRYHSFRRFITSQQEIQEPQNINATKWLDDHEDTVEGFYAWCKDMASDPFLTEQNILTDLFQPSPDILRLMEDVPCAIEFFKYIQWHNLAVQLTYMYNYTTKVVYIEDIDESWAHSIASFLDANVNHTPGTTSGSKTTKNLDDIGITKERLWSGKRYFAGTEREKIDLLMIKLALPLTRDLLDRYFRYF